MKSVKTRGRFTELTLDHNKSKSGDQELLKTCEALAVVFHATPKVFVFDRDNDDVVRRVTEPGKPFKDWGRNVFSLALPIPAHRASESRICIEHLYEDTVLQRRDSNNRRLYLRSEFSSSGRHTTEAVFCQNIKARTLVAEEVFEFAGVTNVSMSKQAFAEAISRGEAPFDDVDFVGFSGVFDVFLAIRAAWLSGTSG